MSLRSIFTLLVSAALLASASAADTIRKVAVEFEANAAGYKLDSIGDPVAISNASQVTFTANGDIFSGSNGSYRPVVKLYDKAPGGVFTRIYTSSLRQNRKGDAVFVATSTYGPYGATHDGIFLRSAGKIYALAFEGAKAPGGGVFKDFYLFYYYNAPRVSDSAGVAFFAETTGTGAPGAGLYFARIVNGAVVVQSVALVNDPAPDGGTFTDIVGGFSDRPWSVTAAGEVVFSAETSLANYVQLFCWKDGTVVAIPNSANTTRFALNNAGQIAYFGSSESGNSTALRLAGTDGASSQEVLSSGDQLPDGTYIGIFDYVSKLALNEAGEIAFGAATYTDPNDPDPGSAIYVWSPDGIRTIAVSGPAPGGGIFGYLAATQPLLGNNGLVYFVADVQPSYDQRLFKHDKTTLTPVLSVGDPLNGDSVASITAANVTPESANQQPVNDRGELAFSVSFDKSGLDGLFVVTPPPFPPVITAPSSSVPALVGQRFTYTVQAANFPTQFSATLADDSKLPAGWTINAAGVLTGIPTAPGTYTIKLHAANAGGSGDAQMTITVADVSGYKGPYSGLAVGATGNATDTGLINVTIGAKPTFTAGGTFAGVPFAAGGVIRADGAIVFKTRTGQTVRLQLDLAQPHPSIPATIEDASNPPKVIASFNVDSTPLRNALQSPSPLAGTYTFILPRDAALPSTANYPAGPGVGTIKVAATGGVTLTTYLADGSLPFIAKGTLTTTGKYRFALPKHAGAFLAGDFTLEDPSVGDSVAGSVIWQRAGQTTASHITVEGSRYRRPTGTGTLLAGPLSFRFTGGGITDPDPQSVTLTTAADRPPNAIQFTPGSTLKKATAAASGLLTGSFTASAPTLTKPGTFSFRGVFLQKQNRAEGFFKGPAGVGDFTLQQ